jgi:2-oxoglutarate dehydrogenase complex dehydrogenase (E1) component-like enzyme
VLASLYDDTPTGDEGMRSVGRTGLPIATLKWIAQRIARPEGIDLHPKVKQLNTRRWRMVDKEGRVDMATAEQVGTRTTPRVGLG